MLSGRIPDHDLISSYNIFTSESKKNKEASSDNVVILHNNPLNRSMRQPIVELLHLFMETRALGW